MPTTSDLQFQCKQLSILLEKLSSVNSLYEKIAILNACPEVKNTFFKADAFFLKAFLAEKSLSCEYVIKAAFAIFQGERIFSKGDASYWKDILQQLLELELLYQDLGGIVGYQCQVINKLLESDVKASDLILEPPYLIDIQKSSFSVKKAVYCALKSMETMAEIYPIGGAADRLNLKSHKDGERLPASSLIFCGITLLEGVMRDLQAREYLHYKVFHKRLTTPVVMMTSQAYKNDQLIKEFCHKKHWFGRSKESFLIFSQPMVPTFDKQGNWCLKSPAQLLLKPGGHGMLWKLLRENHGFKWLRNHGREKALVRQINNPVAGVDYGLLAFIGFGILGNKRFGFASCSRIVNAHEGMNVIKNFNNNTQKVLTNIEYCEMENYNMEDIPVSSESPYSQFPSNTNILFAHLQSVEAISIDLPYPGVLANFRDQAHLHSEYGASPVARIETMMQNIADGFYYIQNIEESPVYLTFNKRQKTISTTKKQSQTSSKIELETPQKCLYDTMCNHQELLIDSCHIQISSVPDEAIFFNNPLPFLFRYHPALGPLYSIIAQKIYGESWDPYSELALEIVDVSIQHLELSGSVLIEALQVTGHVEGDKSVYSERTGQCILHNVRVVNQGVDWSNSKAVWEENGITRHERLQVTLEGHSRFIARDVCFSGDMHICVPDGFQVTAYEKEDTIYFHKKPLLVDEPPLWIYTVSSDYEIELSLNISVIG